MRVLVTGGAGFVGTRVCTGLARKHPNWDVVALDNLKRRGSELNLPLLRAAGVTFAHGDVRNLDDVIVGGAVDALVEASAEPSVLAGIDGGLDYLVQTNLVGAFNCLEACRRFGAQLVFLSTSRVYPVAALCALSYHETETRFELDGLQTTVGASSLGVSETFPLQGARTFYGATKLAAEHLIAEYAEAFRLPAVVNRCGVLAGPGQFGKIDQGVFSFWMLSHHLGRPLTYIGFGGTGKQVRDVLHVDDLVELIDEQLLDPERWRGAVFNVGGGLGSSLSLLELTDTCRGISGRQVEIATEPTSRPGDVPIYLSDCAALFEFTTWRPTKGPQAILEDISSWVTAHLRALQDALD